VTGPGRVLGADLDLSDVGELAPVLTAVAALAEGPSTLRGIGHLRHHETDRLAALSREIGALGGDVRETADGLEVHPRRLREGRFETYEDHRLATAAAVLGLRVAGVEVVDVATTAKTLPTFVALWEQMLTARSVEGRRG
jgi:3-phosphoshikimate 1-carboxyvinyltransferase